MTFRLRTIGLTATGREIVRERELEDAEITLGRAAENDVSLPDLAVEARHARITDRGEGQLLVEAVSGLAFTRDGSDTKREEIDARGGAELGFGTFRVTISREAGDVLLTVRQVEDAASKSGDLEQKRGFSLGGVLPGKRTMAWILAGVILLAFLAVPIFSHLTRDVAARQHVIGDASWSTGKLSLAHHGLEDECEACHVRAFEAVRDETCLSCHEDIHDHGDPARLALARGEGSWGDRIQWKVAHTFGKEGPGACSDCHTEHEGPTKLTAPSQQFCADCHGTLDQRLTDTALGNASDFGRAHPQFEPAVITNALAAKPVRISLAANPREDNGLKFPHKLHLDSRGGVARMAANIGAEQGYGSGGLECKDCHTPTEDGIRFKPIVMEDACESCHSLTYDQVGGIFRKLTHGDVDQVIADLSAADTQRPLAQPRRRPGDYAQGRPYYFNFSAPVWRGLQFRSALSPDGVCGECHRPMIQTNGRPGVVPVTLPQRFMHHGWFDHEAHKQEECTSCHLAEQSTTSADLLLPGIKTCRECHLGEDAVKAEVPSSCAMCHGYHTTATGVAETTNKKDEKNNRNRQTLRSPLRPARVRTEG